MSNTNTQQTRFTPEQKEAWINAKLLLKSMIAEGQDPYRRRALHIAMSELRARYKTHKGPIETHSENPNKRTQRISLDSYHSLGARVSEWKDFLENPDKKKLFIIVRDDLSPSQKAVQASHAAAQFQKEHPLAPWINGTMVLLTEKPREKNPYGFAPASYFDSQEPLNGYGSLGTYTTVWREPDQDNRITAIATLREFNNAEISKRRDLQLL